MLGGFAFGNDCKIFATVSISRINHFLPFNELWTYLRNQICWAILLHQNLSIFVWSGLGDLTERCSALTPLKKFENLKKKKFELQIFFLHRWAHGGGGTGRASANSESASRKKKGVRTSACYNSTTEFWICLPLPSPDPYSFLEIYHDKKERQNSLQKGLSLDQYR